MKDYKIDSYLFDLSSNDIAQIPIDKRDNSKLLLADSNYESFHDSDFHNILSIIDKNDIIIVNDTKVFPARIFGTKDTGGKVEVLLLNHPQIIIKHPFASQDEHPKEYTVKALIRSSKKPKIDSVIYFTDQFTAIVETLLPDGMASLRIISSDAVEILLEKHGKMPLPPYINHPQAENMSRERYQTVYAQEIGAVAAPTAGLHITQELLDTFANRGTEIIPITLHVGYGTFVPVRVKDIRNHKIHGEQVIISASSAERINRKLAEGSRLWAIGTTVLRALEFASDREGRVHPVNEICQLYIYPGYEFKVVHNLITNFHLPGSSLLFLVSAFAGRERILRAYEHAIKKKYRFYSYGDAMALIGYGVSK